MLRDAWLRSVFSPADMAASSVNAAAAYLAAEHTCTRASVLAMEDAAGVAGAEGTPALLGGGWVDTSVTQSRHLATQLTSAIKLAEATELAAASVSQAHAFRQPVPLRRHSYCGGAEKPDCVEQCLREVFSLLLWDAENMRFETERLPLSAAHGLHAFFARENEVGSSSSSTTWFALCQASHSHTPSTAGMLCFYREVTSSS